MNRDLMEEQLLIEISRYQREFWKETHGKIQKDEDKK